MVPCKECSTAEPECSTNPHTHKIKASKEYIFLRFSQMQRAKEGSKGDLFSPICSCDIKRNLKINTYKMQQYRSLDFACSAKLPLYKSFFERNVYELYFIQQVK